MADVAAINLDLNEPCAFCDAVRSYPRPAGLVEDIAQLHRVSAENILLTAGADAALDAVCRSARPGTALVLDPDFPRYAEHAHNAGLVVRRVPFSRKRPVFEFPTDQFLAAVEAETSLVVISTVANPTGVSIPNGLVHRIRDAAPATLIVIDEVYSRFVAANYTLAATETPNVLSINSLSKVGWPGIRVGWIVGHPSTIYPVRRFVSPFAVAGSSVAIARGAIANHDRWALSLARQRAAHDWLVQELKCRGIEAVGTPANWVLANFEAAAHRVVEALAARGINIKELRDCVLAGWVRISTPDVGSLGQFLKTLDELLDAPFEEKGGWLIFKPGRDSAASMVREPFVAKVFGDIVVLDHIVVTRPTREDLDADVREFVEAGGRLVEEPGVWPGEFCPDIVEPDLQMHFASVVLPSGGIVVLAAPRAEGDQLSRFRARQGTAGVHHVAVGVDDVLRAGDEWRKRGFMPKTRQPLDDGKLVQWFFQNEQGQIVELIHRRGGGQATFSCENMTGLRRSENQ